MPVSVSMVCETTTANVTAALRESLGNNNNGHNNNNGSCSSATAATGKAADDCGISSSAALMTNVGDGILNYIDIDPDDNDFLQNKLISSAKAVLLSKIDYVEVDNYGQSVLETLKSKYVILKPLTNVANGSNNSNTTTENGRTSPAATCNNNNNTTNTSSAKNNGYNHSSNSSSSSSVATTSNVVFNGVGSSGAADCNGGNENGSSTASSTTLSSLSSSSTTTATTTSNTTTSNVAANIANGPRRSSSLSHELPQPKRILFSRENVRIGWKNGTRKWQIGVGMMNVGNTCYLNSVLQALFHVPSMAHYLVSESQHMDRCEGGDAGCIICAMCKTLLQSQTHTSPIRPYFVYTRLRTICKHLVMGRQEDAHEFLRYLVEAMEKSFLTRLRMPKDLDQYSKETTPMNQILGGYLRSAVRCLSCGHVSVTFQHFQDLLLDIRKADTLEEALEGYFARERLEDMGYKCESCKKKVSATKQFTLERAPIALCIQLKRFSMIGSKLNKQITIRLRLDLSRYLTRKNSNESCSYKLVSMITHLGASQHCGHYTAIGLTESGAYYHFDDSYVRPISAQNVCNTNAYVIFYELDNPLPSSSSSTTIQRSTATITSTQSNETNVKENNNYQTKTNGYPLSIKSNNNNHNNNNNLDNATNGTNPRMIGPQLPPGGLQNYSTNNGGIKLKNVISNCSSTSSSSSAANSTSTTGTGNPNPKIQIHFKNSLTTSTIRSNATTSSSLNSTNKNNNATNSTLLNGNAGTSITTKQNMFGGTSKANNVNDSLRQFSIVKESSCELEPEDGISSTTDGYVDCNVTSSASPSASASSLPSMPNLGEDEDKSKQRNITPAIITTNNNNVKKNNSLVPYDLESDDDNTGNTIIRRQDSQSPASVASERSEKHFVKSLKRSSSFSQLENGSNNNNNGVSTRNYDFNNLNSNKTRKITNGYHHSQNDSLNQQQSKAKHKTDINPIDKIFNSSPKINNDDNNSAPNTDPSNSNSSTVRNYSNNHNHDDEVDDIDTPPNTPIKREKLQQQQQQDSAPDSPPIIQTKTGFWKVSDINANKATESAIATTTPSKLLVTPPKTWTNPFSSKSANTEKLNSPRQLTERAQFSGNGYKAGSKVDLLNSNRFNEDKNSEGTAVNELLQQSHRGYGAPVLTWNGEQNDIGKEVKNESRDQRRQDIEDEEENEMDRGRQKKIKQSNGSRNNNNEYEQTPGFNPFQEQDNQRRWKHNVNTNHNSYNNAGNCNGSGGNGGNNNSNYHRNFGNRLQYNQRNKFYHKRYNNPYNKYQRTQQQNSTTINSNGNSNGNNNPLTTCNNYTVRRES